MPKRALAGLHGNCRLRSGERSQAAFQGVGAAPQSVQERERAAVPRPHRHLEWSLFGSRCAGSSLWFSSTFSLGSWCGAPFHVPVCHCYILPVKYLFMVSAYLLVGLCEGFFYCFGNTLCVLSLGPLSDAEFKSSPSLYLVLASRSRGFSQSEWFLFWWGPLHRFFKFYGSCFWCQAWELFAQP